MRTIEVTVAPDGRVAVATRGFTGPSCREAGRAVEEALGRLLDERLTPEYYAAAEVRPEIRQSNG